MDSRISMSTQEFLEDIWNNEGIVPVGIEEEKRHLEDTKLCEEIEERYKEKGE